MHSYEPLSSFPSVILTGELQQPKLFGELAYQFPLITHEQSAWLLQLLS